jgi:4a-hydroxytetrahydrobiopterin dehydratase
MSEESKERVYQPDEIEARLKRELPHWRYENGWIRRTFRTSGWKGTLMVINAVGHLAEAAWHHPDIAASYAWVEVKLQTIAPRGSPTRTSNLRARLRTSSRGVPAKRAARSKGRRPAISDSPISNTTTSDR